MVCDNLYEKFYSSKSLSIFNHQCVNTKNSRHMIIIPVWNRVLVYIIDQVVSFLDKCRNICVFENTSFNITYACK